MQGACTRGLFTLPMGGSKKEEEEKLESQHPLQGHSSHKLISSLWFSPAQGWDPSRQHAILLDTFEVHSSTQQEGMPILKIFFSLA